MKAKELIGFTVEELKQKHEDCCAEIFELVNELKVNRKLEKPHLLSQKRKDRARILTVLRQKADQPK